MRWSQTVVIRRVDCATLKGFRGTYCCGWRVFKYYEELLVRGVSILGHLCLPFINDGWSLGKDRCQPMQKMQAPLHFTTEFHRMPQDHLRKIPQDDKTIQSQWCCSAVQYLFGVCETLEGIETASHNLVN